LCLDAGLRRVVAASQGLEAVAGFSVTLTLGSLAWVVLKAFGAAWSPVLYRADRAHVRPLLDRVLRALLLLALAVQVAVSWGAPLLARVFLPPSYAGGAALVVVAVAACSVPATLLSVQIATFFDAAGTRPLAVATPLGVVAAVGAAVPLAHRFGAVGAASCYPLAFGLCVALLARVGRRRSMPSVFGRPVLLAAMVSAALCLVTAALGALAVSLRALVPGAIQGVGLACLAAAPLVVSGTMSTARGELAYALFAAAESVACLVVVGSVRRLDLRAAAALALAVLVSSSLVA